MEIYTEDYQPGLKGNLGKMAQTTDSKQACLIEGIVGVGLCGLKKTNLHKTQHDNH